MRTLVLLFVIFLSPICYSFSISTKSSYLSVDYVEPNKGFNRVDETGSMLGYGLSLNQYLSPHIELEASYTQSHGLLDYQGASQIGKELNSEVDYHLVYSGLAATYFWSLSGFELNAAAQLTNNDFTRNIRQTSESEKVKISREWLGASLQVGLKKNLNSNLGYLVRLGTGKSLSSQVTLDLSSVGLEPASANANSATWRDLKFGFYYLPWSRARLDLILALRQFKWDSSDLISVNYESDESLIFIEPYSEMTIKQVGLRLEYSF